MNKVIYLSCVGIALIIFSYVSQLAYAADAARVPEGVFNNPAPVVKKTPPKTSLPAPVPAKTNTATPGIKQDFNKNLNSHLDKDWVEQTRANNVTDKIHNFSIAPEISNYQYKEPGLMKLKGTMYGIGAEYKNIGGVGHFLGQFPAVLAAQLSYQTGESTYHGATFSGTPVSFGGVPSDVFEGRFLAGYKAQTSQQVAISPYLGFGMRYLDNAKSAPGSYRREQSYLYIPFGADLKVSLQNRWYLTFNAEYDLFLSGKNITHIGDAYTTQQEFDLFYSKITVSQTGGMGIRLSAKLEKDLETIVFFVEPFFRYWNISASNKARWSKHDYDPAHPGVPLPPGTGPGYYVLYEPKNNTTEFGLRVGMRF